jgi:Zn-dependent metalloprotease
MQSGALNESYSDIFGETVDLTNQRGNDSPSVRWQIGEDLPGGAIRDMWNPWMYRQPGKLSDPQWQHDPTQDGGGCTQTAAFQISRMPLWWTVASSTVAQ